MSMNSVGIPEAEAPRLEFRGVSRSYSGGAGIFGVDLALGEAEVVCLLGPSGCGKSTTLRIAAGLERQDRGEVLLGGSVVSGPHHHVPPERRSVGMMFQDFALFPHLTALQNAAFGLRRGETAQAERLLGKVGLGRMGGKYPHELSGGEQQRVALARALAPAPRVLLMDEPFSGLDDRLRDGIREETLAVLAAESTAVLIVTHDPAEAMRVADRIVLMRSGRVVQEGAPYNIYNAPADLEAALFFTELNIIPGEVRQGQIETAFGPFLQPGLAEGTRVEVAIRPQHLKLDFDRKGGPLPTREDGVPARGQVERARFVGRESLIELRMDHDGSLLSATVPGVFMPPKGTVLWMSLRRDRCLVFPARGAGAPGRRAGPGG
jgi:iron(III) transport system ATP-binding protein